MVAIAKSMGRHVAIPAGQRTLKGVLSLPVKAEGVVLFAHGSGSGRFSPRNQYVAESLAERGLGTLLLDLLDEEEAMHRENVFDIRLLADRLQYAAEWLLRESKNPNPLQLGYFGASTGTAAALIAAGRKPATVSAIVSRGGRPDLAETYLDNVQAPTLLIVGSDDDIVLEINHFAFNRMHCRREIVIVPDATHLFEEPGALEEVARLAGDWFVRFLTTQAVAKAS